MLLVSYCENVDLYNFICLIFSFYVLYFMRWLSTNKQQQHHLTFYSLTQIKISWALNLGPGWWAELGLPSYHIFSVHTSNFSIKIYFNLDSFFKIPCLQKIIILFYKVIDLSLGNIFGGYTFIFQLKKTRRNIGKMVQLI